MTLISVLLAVTSYSSTVAGLPPGNQVEETWFGKLATCQETWFDWKDDDRRMSQYIDRFNANFTHGEEDPAFLPKGPGKVLGFPLIKVYPSSVGTGVGFSLQLGGQLSRIQKEVEHQLGKSLECSISDGMTSCGLELGENKSVVLMAFGEGDAAINLLGCYYTYEK
ncbi:MAG: hypothetical protein ABI866_01190 [Dokdonella sp.]